MGCLFLLLMMLSPRLGIIFLWAFTDYVSRSFSTWIWPLLGFLFLPFATLMYVILYTPGFGLTAWEWFWVILAGVFDLAHLAAGIARRRELMARA